MAGGSVQTGSISNANIYTNPDGSHTAMVYGTPINFETTSGVWAPIDNTLVPIAGGAGFHNAAGPINVNFAPVATGRQMVTVGSGANAVSFGLNGASTSIAEASGSTITYPNVVPNTNLEYNVTNTELKETLVLTQAPLAGAGVDFDFPIDCHGCFAAVGSDGSATISIAGKTIYRIAAPVVWDSTPQAGLGNGEPAEGPAHISVAQDDQGIWHLYLSVAPGWLQDPERAYPVYVDPTLAYGTGQNGSGDDASVQSFYPAYNGDSIHSNDQGRFIDQVGYWGGGPNPPGNTESFFHYDVSSLNGAHIQAATWHAYFCWSGQSYATDYWLRAVAGPWNAGGITWSSQPPVYSNPIQDTAKKYEWHSLDITGWVSSWTGGASPNNGVEVDTGSEGQTSWKNIAADENGAGGSASYLQVTYDFPPTMASPASPANGSSFHTAKPTLSVNPSSDPDGSAVQYEFRLAESSDVATNLVWDSGLTSSTSVTLPKNLIPNRPYYWRVWTYDGAYWTQPNWVWSFTPTDATPSNPQDANPADGASVSTTTPTLYSSTSTDPDSGDAVSYVFTIYSGPDGTGQVASSGNVASSKWAPPARILNDGASYYWSVQATDGWLTSAPSPVHRLAVDLGLGSQPDQPYDSLGPATVNLANGNLFVSTALPSFKAVGGPLGIGLAYNSGKPNNQGLTGHYYNDTNGDHLFDSWKTPQLIRVDSTINFNWQGQPPYPSINATNFLVRWTGYVTVPNAGQYQFGTIADDGSEIWIGSPATTPPEFNNWVEQGAPATPQWGSPVTFAAGQTQPITIQYFQGPDVDSIQLWVSGPGGANSAQIQAPVPASWLTTDLPGLPDGWTVSPSGGPQYSAARVTDKEVTLFDPVGRAHGYTFTGTAWVPPAGEDGVLTVDSSSGQLTLHASDGLTYVFNKDGTLASAVSPTSDLAPAQPQYTYSGTPSRLTQITDPVSQRAITLDYADPSGSSPACPSTSSGPGAGFSAPPNYMLCKVDYSAFGAGETDLFYSNGHLARIVNPGGAITDFGYDTSARLAKVRDVLNNDQIACGPSACSGYYGSDTASSIGADKKHMWLFGYSGSRVASITAPLSGPSLPQPAHTYSYDGGATRVHDALIHDNSSGYVRRVVFDNLGRTLQDFDLAGNATTTNTWDAYKHLLTSTDATKIETTHVYDAAHRLTDTYGPGNPSEFASDGTSTTAPHLPMRYDEQMNYLAATWWGNKDMAGVPLTHSTSSVQETSSTLPSQLPAQNFSGRLTGEINLPSAGVYDFNLTAAGGARLYLDDQKILDDWGGPYFSAVQADKPSEYWRLNEQSGLTTANDVEQLHSGTYATGVNPVAGALSGDSDTAASFDGSSQYITVGSDPGYFGGGMTIEVWAYPTAVGSYARFVDFGNGPQADNIILARVGTSNDLTLAVVNGGTTVTSVTASGVISINQWQHFVATITPSGAVALYKNGLQVATGTGQLPAPVTRTTNYLGKSNWTTTGDALYQGSMDEVALYPYALSATRVLAHYNAGTAPDYTVSGSTAAYPNALKADFPLSYWRLDEPSGSSFASDLEHINDGTFVHSPTLGASGALVSDSDKAVSFNGTNQYVSVVPQDTVTGSFSVEAWINPSTTTGDLGILGTRSPGDVGFDMQILNGKLHGDIGDGTNWLATNVDAATPLAANTWYQVVYVVNKPSWTVYINGVQASSGTLVSGTPLLWDSTHQLTIGNVAPGSVYPFSGKIDDVSVYGMALSPGQVADHYTAGTSPNMLVTGASAPLAPGAHRIRIEYQGLAAPGQLNLNWKPQGGTFTAVPASALRPRLGLVTSQGTPDGKTTQIAYSKPMLGLPTSSTVDPGTGHLNLTSTATYEAASSSTYYRVLSTALPNGSQTADANTYYGAMQAVANPCVNGSAAVSQAGALESTTGATPTSGGAIIHDYVYDAIGRVVATRVRGDSNWDCTTYDARGRTATDTDRLGRQTTYDYSAPGQVTVTGPDSTGIMHTTVNVVDWLGRPLSYADENGTLTRTVYDQAGRVTDTYRTFSSQAETHLTHIDYDPASGWETALTEYASTSSQRISYAYDQAGRLVTTTRPNNVLTTNTYDAARGWLNQTNTTEGSNALAPWSYQRNPSATVQSETGNGRKRTFTYDGAGRLGQAVDSPGSTRQYAYDLDSNRCAMAGSCSTPTYTYDNADRLLSSPAASGYQYDSHGNLLSATPTTCSGCATKEVIAYDAHDRATSIDDGRSTTVDTRAPSGRLLRETVSSDSTHGTVSDTTYGYDGSGDSPAYSKPTGGGALTTYLIGPTGLLLVDTGGAPAYPIQDGRSDVVGYANASGVYTASPDFTEFGVTQPVPSQLAWLGGAERFQTAGSLGLVRMGARLYDPTAGRFLEVDPIRGGSANDYVYANQDPINASDPNGSFYTICDTLDCALQEGSCSVCHSYPTNGSDFNMPPSSSPSSSGGPIVVGSMPPGLGGPTAGPSPVAVQPCPPESSNCSPSGPGYSTPDPGSCTMEEGGAAAGIGGGTMMMASGAEIGTETAAATFAGAVSFGIGAIFVVVGVWLIVDSSARGCFYR